MYNLNEILPETIKYLILDFDQTIAKTSHIWPEVNQRWFKALNVDENLEEFEKEAQNMTLEATCQLLY